jgi:uncharacterized protein (DUF2249 family)
MQVKAPTARAWQTGRMTSTTPFADLDVRPLFAQGRPPLPVILDAVSALPAGHGLRLIAPLEPTPLYTLLGKQGFRAEARAREDGSWEILFHSATPAELDLRDLPPPEPMQRALAALADLPAGAPLTVLTRFRPAHLLEHLAARGYSGISEELPDQSWRTVLHPTSASAVHPQATPSS